MYLSAGGGALTLTTGRTDGLLHTLWNPPVRGCLWRIEQCSFHPLRHGDFALCNERGEVFVASVVHSEYRLIRRASSPIACVAYIPASPKHLLLAYENGALLVCDTGSGHVAGKLAGEGASCVRVVRTHPSRPLAVSASDDRTIGLWDLQVIVVLVRLRPLQRQPQTRLTTSSLLPCVRASPAPRRPCGVWGSCPWTPATR